MTDMSPREELARIIDPWAFGIVANIQHTERAADDREKAYAKADKWLFRQSKDEALQAAIARFDAYACDQELMRFCADGFMTQEDSEAWSVVRAALSRHVQPVAWRVKDFADGWVYFEDEERARREAEATGGALQALFR